MVSTSIFLTMILYIFNVLKEKKKSVSKLTYLYCDAEIVSSKHPALLNETMNHLNQKDLRSKTVYLNVSFKLYLSCTFILGGNTFLYCIQTHNLVCV